MAAKKHRQKLVAVPYHLLVGIIQKRMHEALCLCADAPCLSVASLSCCRQVKPGAFTSLHVYNMVCIYVFKIEPGHLFTAGDETCGDLSAWAPAVAAAARPQGVVAYMEHAIIVSRYCLRRRDGQRAPRPHRQPGSSLTSKTPTLMSSC